MPEYARALFIRLDRIGDLVLTLPVDEKLNGSAVDWWIPPGLRFITESAEPRRSAREVQKKISWRDFLGLWRELRAQRYDLAVVFHAPWWVSFLLWCARVPVRGGVRSQWHSFLFLNRGIRQKRSRAEFSELEYNFQLVEAVLGRPRTNFARGALRLKTPENPALLARFGLRSGRYCVVHPGMGGSALNWPTGHYADLIRQLAAGTAVAITGTPADAVFLEPLKRELKDAANVIWLDGQLTGLELLAILGQARAVIAPSTGVLHLAASTGALTIGIFSPVRVQHPRRWGPQGARASVLVPPVDSCPGELGCVGRGCKNFGAGSNCMARIEVSDLVAKLAAPAAATEKTPRA